MLRWNVPTDWRIEDANPLPPLSTREEYAQEAREDGDVVCFFKLKPTQYSAVWNRDVLRRRYKRECEFTQTSKFWPIFFTYLFAGVGSTPASLGLAYGYSSAQNELLVSAIPMSVMFWIIAPILVPLSMTGMALGVLRIKFRFCFSRTTAFQQMEDIYDQLRERELSVARILGQLVDSPANTERRLSLIDGRMRMWTPTLAWEDKEDKGRYLVGSRYKNRRDKAEVHLQIPENMQISELGKNHKIVYDWSPRIPEHTGNAGTVGKNYFAKWHSVGEDMLNELGKKSVRKFLRDNIVLFVILGLLLANILMYDRAASFTNRITELATEAAQVKQGIQVN